MNPSNYFGKTIKNLIKSLIQGGVRNELLVDRQNFIYKLKAKINKN